MKTVVVTTDIFRCREFGLQSVAQNAHWLRGLVHDVFSPDDFELTTFLSNCDEGGFEVGHYRRCHRLANNASDWAGLVNMAISSRYEAFFGDLLKAKLVIGWGLTPALLELIDRHGIPFVDVEVDPIRFGDDLLLRVRTNHPGLSGYFSSLHVDESAFSPSVAEIRAFVARIEPAAVRPGSTFGLFAGQCAIDLSIVRFGRVARPVDYIGQIRSVAAGVDTLLVKSHPGEDDPSHIATILDAVPNARMTHANIYRILSDINLKRVVALSSSVLDEAAAFGVKTSRLITPDRDASDLIPPSTSRWYRIPAEGMAHGGLMNAFRGTADSRPNVLRRRLDLRRSLNTNWGLEDLYSGQHLSFNMKSRRRWALTAPYRKVGAALRAIF